MPRPPADPPPLPPSSEWDGFAEQERRDDQRLIIIGVSLIAAFLAAMALVLFYGAAP
jgi:hypothetical protein